MLEQERDGLLGAGSAVTIVRHEVVQGVLGELTRVRIQPIVPRHRQPQHRLEHAPQRLPLGRVVRLAELLNLSFEQPPKVDHLPRMFVPHAPMRLKN